MFGVTGRNIGSWMPKKPVQLDDSYLTKQIFIGPNSPNPDAVLFNQDYNNFGPAVGFSWQLPWFGRNRTVLRGGYQLSYRAIGNASNSGYGASIANAPGTTYNQYYRGSTTDTYLSVANLADHIPASRFLDPSIVPLDVMHITDHSTNYTAYDPNIRTPYTHNINLSLTRVIKNNITIDVRYVGTLARKGIGDINLNTPNVYRNGLSDALNEARAGGNPALLDQMLTGFVYGQIGNWTAVGAGGPTGADVVRGKYGTNLANGDYATIATSLANLNYDKKVSTANPFSTTNTAQLINQQYPDLPSNVQGAILRANGFPENYILTNPQMGQAMYRSNLIHSNYHSLQAQVQVRPTRGLMFTSTYTFAKTLAGQPGGNMGGFFGGGGSWTDPMNRSLDYKLNGYGGKHQWNNYGIMDLPIGANGYFLRGLSNGMLRRLLEGWQFSWNLQMQSGSPSQVTDAVSHMYNTSFFSKTTLMDLVPITDPKWNPTQDPKYGMQLAMKLAPNNSNLEWPAGSATGYYFGGGVTPNRYVSAADPQCAAANSTWANYTTTCTLKALYLVNPDGSQGPVILQNPAPGHQGNFSRYIEGLGSFSLDMGMTKNIMVTENKSVQVRMQATNILNHPQPCSYGGYGFGNMMMTNCPSLTVGNNFGTVTQKGGNRMFQGNFRLLF